MEVDISRLVNSLFMITIINLEDIPASVVLKASKEEKSKKLLTSPRNLEFSIISKKTSHNHVLRRTSESTTSSKTSKRYRWRFLSHDCRSPLCRKLLDLGEGLWII